MCVVFGLGFEMCLVVELGIGVGVGQGACGTVHATGEIAVLAFGARLGAFKAPDASDCAGPGDGRFIGGRAPGFHAVDGAGGGGSQGLFLVQRSSMWFSGFTCDCGGG